MELGCYATPSTLGLQAMQTGKEQSHTDTPTGSSQRTPRSGLLVCWYLGPHCRDTRGRKGHCTELQKIEQKQTKRGPLSGSLIKLKPTGKVKRISAIKAHQTTVVGKLEKSPPPIGTWAMLRGRTAGTCSTTLQNVTLQEVRELNLGLAARNQPESQESAAGLLRLIDLDLHTAAHVDYCDSRDVP
ncbi:hypothetical protein H920_01440 [Fukomys damarensis]|uniref:Uncharacterized protein n=1 Tax=Fukomys damarensis TaxID=885580 RepID=A0A091ENC3_FUKDA|nr:hypothetical protein H920_01440 [Fukomys damarensis]